MNFIIKSSDKYGVTASVLCMLHCTATPLLFMTQAHTSAVAHDVPFLWLSINYVFLLISSLAVYYSIQKSTKHLSKFYCLFFGLCCVS